MDQEFKKDSNKALIISGLVIAILVVGLITNGFGLFNPKSTTGSVINQGQVELSIEKSPVLGNENAPVTLYVFSDFSCPYCAAAAGYNTQTIASLKKSNPNWEAPLPNIIENEVKEGKVKIVFKYASGHGTGRPAHLVGYALNEQGLFWEFHDLAFANQADVGDLNKMKALAEEVGANMTLLNEYLDSNKANFLVQADLQMANANNVQGTPTFFINDKEISGAQTYSTFQKLIEQELN